MLAVAEFSIAIDDEMLIGFEVMIEDCGGEYCGIGG